MKDVNRRPFMKIAGDIVGYRRPLLGVPGGHGRGEAG